MFNWNEDNRIVMSQHPTDMRMGVNGMCGQTHFPDLFTHTIHSHALDMRNHSKQYGLFRIVAK